MRDIDVLFTYPFASRKFGDAKSGYMDAPEG